MNNIHKYQTQLNWTGNLGQGTANYKTYSRNHSITSPNKPEIACSSDPHFLGDKTRFNPEDMLVASASACHMLTYLHLCADEGVVVLDYCDTADGTMIEEGGGGHFTEIVLHPIVTVKDKSMVEKAMELHHKANPLCFIASSCNFPIKHQPVIKVA